MAPRDVAVFLNGQDVTRVFQPEAGGHSLLGLVGGLSVGKNNLTAKAIDKHNQPYLSARLTLTNYPITGPIFSGPHEEPFYCMTQLFKLPASTQTLGSALELGLLNRDPCGLRLPNDRGRVQTTAKPYELSSGSCADNNESG